MATTKFKVQLGLQATSTILRESTLDPNHTQTTPTSTTHLDTAVHSQGTAEAATDADAADADAADADADGADDAVDPHAHPEIRAQ